MKNGRIIKRILDPLMVILLPFLMAQILTGQQMHEWLGSAMGICFILHNALNARWYKNIFKGEYTPFRTLMTVVNLLLTTDILAIMASGIMMSDYVFGWLGISGHMVLARRLHIFSAWWGFLLMSGHLGLHWQMVMGGLRRMFRIENESAARTFVLRILCAVFSAYGIYAFIANHVSDYILLKTHFMFFDESKPAIVFLAEMSAMICLFAAAFHYFSRGLAGLGKEKKSKDKKIWKWLAFLIPAAVVIFVVIMFNLPGNSINAEWGGTDTSQETEVPSAWESAETSSEIKKTEGGAQSDIRDGFVLIQSGTFLMGSPEDEAWRGNDETQHEVTLGSFYISPYELTQAEYEEVTGINPSSFRGEDFPVENVSWLEAVEFCNALSEKRGLAPAYMVDGKSVSWDRSATGYRLPTEAEWEYAYRAGSTTPFNMDPTPGADRCNFYGHYPYQIEENYFSQGNLTTKPGEYRQATVEVDRLAPDAGMGEGLSIHYSGGSTLKEDIASWLEVNSIESK